MLYEVVENAVETAILLLKRRWVPVRGGSLSLGLCLRNDFGLMDSTLDYLLFFRVEILGEILV